MAPYSPRAFSGRRPWKAASVGSKHMIVADTDCYHEDEPVTLCPLGRKFTACLECIDMRPLPISSRPRTHFWQRASGARGYRSFDQKLDFVVDQFELDDVDNTGNSNELGPIKYRGSRPGNAGSSGQDSVSRTSTHGTAIDYYDEDNFLRNIGDPYDDEKDIFLSALRKLFVPDRVDDEDEFLCALRTLFKTATPDGRTPITTRTSSKASTSLRIVFSTTEQAAAPGSETQAPAQGEPFPAPGSDNRAPTQEDRATATSDNGDGDAEDNDNDSASSVHTGGSTRGEDGSEGTSNTDDDGDDAPGARDKVEEDSTVRDL